MLDMDFKINSKEDAERFIASLEIGDLITIFTNDTKYYIEKGENGNVSVSTPDPDLPFWFPMELANTGVSRYANKAEDVIYNLREAINTQILSEYEDEQ